MLAPMSGTEERLKSCVQCGAILKAGQATCDACHTTQPAPGAPRPPREPAPSEAPSAWTWRSVLLPIAVLGLLVAFVAGMQVMRDKIRSRAARGGTAGATGATGAAGQAGDARDVVPTAHESASDAFGQLADRGALAVKVDLQRSVESYPVEGTTSQQIFASIDANGPDGPDGKAVGLTRLQSGEYQYAHDPDSGRCVVTKLEAQLTITVPRLTSSTVPLAIDEKWRDYLRAVTRHEEHHADIYSSAVDRVAEKLRFEQPFADRSAMQAGFTAAWSAEMDVAERENSDFHRHEEQGIAQEKADVTRELRRVDAEIETIAARLKSQQADADRVRYDALLAERAGLVERGLWLH